MLWKTEKAPWPGKLMYSVPLQRYPKQSWDSMVFREVLLPYYLSHTLMGSLIYQIFTAHLLSPRAWKYFGGQNNVPIFMELTLDLCLLFGLQCKNSITPIVTLTFRKNSENWVGQVVIFPFPRWRDSFGFSPFHLAGPRKDWTWWTLLGDRRQRSWVCEGVCTGVCTPGDLAAGKLHVFKLS